MRRATFSLTTGTLFAQFASLVFIPVVSNVSGPQTYGKYLLLLSLATAILPFHLQKIDIRIVSSRSDSDAVELFIVNLRRNKAILFCAIPVIAILFLVPNFEASLLFSACIWTFALLAIQSLSISSLSYLLYLGKFKRYNLFGVLQNLLSGIIQLLLFSFIQSVNMLVLGYLLGRLSTVFFVLFSNFDTFQNEINFRLNLGFLKEYSLETSTIYGIFEGINLLVPLLLCHYFFDQIKLGYLGLAQTILSLPITLLGSNLSNVIILESRKLNFTSSKISEFNVLLRKVLFWFLPLVFLVVLSEILFMRVNFFGILNSDWSGIRSIFGILVFPFGLQLLFSPYLGIFVASGYWNILIKQNLIAFSIGFVAFTICMQLHSPWYLSILSFHLGRAFSYIYALFKYYELLKFESDEV